MGLHKSRAGLAVLLTVMVAVTMVVTRQTGITTFEPIAKSAKHAKHTLISGKPYPKGHHGAPAPEGPPPAELAEHEAWAAQLEVDLAKSTSKIAKSGKKKGATVGRPPVRWFVIPHVLSVGVK